MCEIGKVERYYPIFDTTSRTGVSEIGIFSFMNALVITPTRLNEIKHILTTERSVAYSIYLVLRQITDEEKKELGIFDNIERLFNLLFVIEGEIGMDIERAIKEYENSSDL